MTSGADPGTIHAFDRLLSEVRSCAVCASELPFPPRPILRGRPSARLLIISQAPGTQAQAAISPRAANARRYGTDSCARCCRQSS